MNLSDLENIPAVKLIVDDIINDEEFKRRCELNFKQIFSDGKLDRDDIPLLINLVLTILQNHKKINVTKVDLKPVLMLLLGKLIDQFKGESKLDEQLILLLIEPQIDLLLMSVRVSNCKWGCCGSKPEKEEHIINKLKVNKTDKKRLESILP
jgi:hypothetical protein